MLTSMNNNNKIKIIKLKEKGVLFFRECEIQLSCGGDYMGEIKLLLFF